MADFFANATLKTKLTGITMLVCSIVLFLSSSAFLAAEVFSFRKIMVGNSASLADVIAANSAIALAFEDRALAQNTLAALAAEQHIQVAYIFDRRNQPFARYFRQSGEQNGDGARPKMSQEEFGQLAEGIRAGEKSHRFASNHLANFCPVYFEDQLVGMVYLNTDLSPFYYWLRFFGSAGLLVVGLSFLLAYLLSLRLQQLVSRPILYLVDKMRLVRTEEDFTVRAQKWSEDEVGTLVEGFNGMLARIEDRDAQLERYRQHLEELVFKRTAELHQTVTELENAKTKIEAASRAKSQFLATISHELRTPLVGVLGTSELLMDTGLDSYQRGLVETLNDSGEGLLTILNDLLDLSKIEAGKLTLERIDFNLLEVVETPLHLLAKIACDKSLEMLCHCEPSVPLALRGDPGRLRQVIFNLVGNAVKFTPSGEVVLHVRVEEEQAEQVALRFEVRDTGIGIAPEAQQRIFEAFSQADDSVTRKFGGTGLGLSIVRQLVEKMGGQVGLVSRPGEGTVFHFTVWLEKQGAETSGVVRSPAAAGQRVLVVDDNVSVCRMLRERLSARGLDGTAVGDPNEAISLLLDAAAVGRPFAAVMLDGDLPHGESLRVAGLLAEPRFFTTRLIVLKTRKSSSGSEMPSVCASIHKPLLPSQVDEGISQILSWSASSSASEAKPAENPAVAAASSGKACETGRGRILVAEDNPTTQNLLKISLGSAGHEVIVTDNGRSALETWQNESFDLVLLDFNMPEMDGCAVARKMRSAGCRLPILGLTAHSSEEYFEMCRTAGMNDYLPKPFKHKVLHQVVEKWLAEGTGAGAAQQPVEPGNDPLGPGLNLPHVG